MWSRLAAQLGLSVCQSEPHSVLACVVQQELAVTITLATRAELLADSVLTAACVHADLPKNSSEASIQRLHHGGEKSQSTCMPC